MFYGLDEDKIAKFEQALEDIVEIFGYVYATDMLIALQKNLTFRQDLKFISSFNSVAQTDQENSLLWRLHVLTWAANHALNIEGDFVECGVFRGFSSAVVCKYIDFETLPKQFYLYDTFSGLAEETSTEKERQIWQQYKQVDSNEVFNHVKGLFSPYPNVKIIKGIVPFSFSEAVPEKIAYLHIDMNSAQAEILALEELFHRLSPGGLLILDDFGWIINQEQTLVELKFMLECGHQILELPTGQGLVLKH